MIAVPINSAQQKKCLDFEKKINSFGLYTIRFIKSKKEKKKNMKIRIEKFYRCSVDDVDFLTIAHVIHSIFITIKPICMHFNSIFP